MIVVNRMPLIQYKPVANAFDGYDLDSWIQLEIIAQFGNIDVEVAAVKKGIATPKKVKYIPALKQIISFQV